MFVELVNKAYSLTGKNVLTVKKLHDANGSTGRLVKKAEAYFRLLLDSVPVFSHYDPALYLLQHPELLDGNDELREKSLARFEAAFARIAKFN